MTIPIGEQTINPLPAAQSNFLEILDQFLQFEDANRQAFTWRGWVVDGGVFSPQPGLTGTPSPLTAFPGGFYITETQSITFVDNVTTWVIAHKDTVGDLGPYLRVPGTHYLTAVAVGAPPLPADCVRLMQVDTAAGAITNTVDNRSLFPEYIAGAIPHSRYTGTEPFGLDIRVGEHGGQFTIALNTGTDDLPDWNDRIRFDMAKFRTTFLFASTTPRFITFPDQTDTLATLSDISAGLFAPGTRMVFDQDSAPVGWTRDVSAALDDRVIRLVSGARADGGSWTITGIAVTPHLHDLGSHQHEVPVGESATFNYIVQAAAWPFGFSGNTYSQTRAAAATVQANIGAMLSAPVVGNTGSAAPPVSSDGTWRPLNRAMIVCIKN